MNSIKEEYLYQLENIEKELNIQFNDKGLLFLSLIHDSFVYENEEIDESNERLEFLGDSILGLAISHLLYKRYPDWNEGELALFKSNLVSSDSLSQLASKINLGDFLFLGKGEEASGGRSRSSILSDSLEALIGALYLDLGLDSAIQFIEKLFSGCLDVDSPLKDYKSYLQEFSQKQFKKLPVYSVVEEIGPPHQKIFKVRVTVGDRTAGDGEGTSKKEAEQRAAQSLLRKIEKGKDGNNSSSKKVNTM